MKTDKLAEQENKLAVLGEKDPQKEYFKREGVYGLPVTFSEATKKYVIAVVAVKKEHKGGQEDYHLIGGAMEAEDNGSHLKTLEREFSEETGTLLEEVKEEDYIHRVDVFVNSPTLQCEKLGYYYRVKIIDQVKVPKEPNHRLVVMPIEEALEKLHHASARLIVEYYMREILKITR